MIVSYSDAKYGYPLQYGYSGTPPAWPNHHLQYSTIWNKFALTSSDADDHYHQEMYNSPYSNDVQVNIFIIFFEIGMKCP